MYARDDIASTVALVLTSTQDERIWCLINTLLGPVLLACWYRPPTTGEIASVHSLCEKWQPFEGASVAAIVCCHMNVHHPRWLRFSAHTSVEGAALHNWCIEIRLHECVRAPTRGPSGGANRGGDCFVASPRLPPLELKCSKRMMGWVSRAADWRRLRNTLRETDWCWIARMADSILGGAAQCIPRRECREPNSHPWLDNRRLEVVQARVRVRCAGTPAFAAAQVECSDGLLQAHDRYIQRVRERLRSLARGFKLW